MHGPYHLVIASGPFEKWCIDASKKKVYFGLQSHDFKEEIGNQYNVGVVCGINSNLCVIDIDTKNDGLKIWETLLKDNIDPMLLSPNINIFNILNTFTVKTEKGGYYYYFKYTKCKQLKNYTNLLKCIDIRTQFGQVVSLYSFKNKRI